MRALAVLLLCASSASAEISPHAIGSRVRSEKWNVRRKPYKIEELSGNVVYSKDERSLRADWALFDHQSRLLEAKGAIKIEELLKDGRRLLVRGERARFLDPEHTGSLRGRTDTDAVFVDRLGVAGESLGTGRAQALVWNSQEETLRLEGGRPFLSALEKEWSAAVQADRITAYRTREGDLKIVAEGRASGWLHFPYDDKNAPADLR